MAERSQEAEMISCANPDCRVADTGRCVEAHELNVCPYYGREVENEEAGVEIDEERGPAESLSLPAANTLTLPEASGVLRSTEARVIAVIGPRDSGKTSLIASVYDLFQEGPVGDIRFSRSRTLHAFEQTCHDARAASRRGVPHMNRTPIGDVRFYHVEIGCGEAEERLSLLLGDRAGEEYLAAADDVAVVPSFTEVIRADTLTVLVDGARLLESGGRHNLRIGIIMMLQGLHDGGGLSPASRLAVVLTKLDAVRGGDLAGRVQTDFAFLFSELKRLFGSALSEIEAFQIAASPRTDDLPRGTGVPKLLAFWLKSPEASGTPAPTHPTSRRSFVRLRPHDELMEEAHA